MKLFTLALVATGLAAMLYKKRHSADEPGTQAAAGTGAASSRSKPWTASGGEMGDNSAMRQRSEADGRPASPPQAAGPAGDATRGDLP